MDSLLKPALEAHGWLRTWNKLQSLHANVFVGGALWNMKQLPGLFKSIGIRYVDGFTAPTFADLFENAPFAE
jgi:hypothetical protein